MYAVAVLALIAAADTVRLCAGGDVTLGTNLDTAWARRATGDTIAPFAALRAPDTLIAPLRAIVAGADVVLLNAEGAIGDAPDIAPKCALGHCYCFLLRMPGAAAPALRSVVDSPAVVVANLANNHAHDAGDTGLAETQAWLDSAGVLVTGADTLPTLIPTAGGDTLAILGFSAWSSPGVTDLDAVRRLVAKAAARYRWVVVTVHLGAEGAHAQHVRHAVERFAGEVRGDPVAFAHAVVDAGAQLVIGHGPHVLRAAEWRRAGRALILYSLGNLVNYGPFALGEPMRRGAVACATLDAVPDAAPAAGGRVRDVVLRPTRQMQPGVVEPDSAGVALRLVRTLSRTDFPTTGALVDQATGAVSQLRRSLPRPKLAGPAGSAAAASGRDREQRGEPRAMAERR